MATEQAKDNLQQRLSLLYATLTGRLEMHIIRPTKGFLRQTLAVTSQHTFKISLAKIEILWCESIFEAQPHCILGESG